MSIVTDMRVDFILLLMQFLRGASSIMPSEMDKYCKSTQFCCYKFSRFAIFGDIKEFSLYEPI